MGDVPSTFVYRHTRLGILTEQSAELVDLTDGLGSLLTDTAMETGYLNIQTLHAATGIVVVAARSSTRPDYVGMTAGFQGACVRIADGRLQLRDAERVFLVERDGPAAREIAVVIVGEARR
jgi:thiamine phosphate synthase YjbQ (UPF0047 family)